MKGDICNEQFQSAKGDICNEQFQSAFTRETYSEIPSKGNSPFILLCEITVDPKGVLKLLNGLNVTSTPGHVLTTSLLRPKKIKDVVRTWYGLVGRGRNVVRT